MTCIEQNRILMFDQLNEHEQEKLLEHIDYCSECQAYFDKYLLLEEGLDKLLQETELPIKSMKRPLLHPFFKHALLTCASLLLVILCIWNTTSVKAVIEKALNEIIIEYFQKNDQPLKPTKESATTELITYAEIEYQGQGVTKIYSSGKYERIIYENGNFDVTDGNFYASYSKKDNLFFIRKFVNEKVNPIVKEFKEIDSANIKYLGEKKYINRSVEVYLVSINENLQKEYWFDKETKISLKMIEISNGQRQDTSDIKEFKVIEVKKDHKLFDFIAPEGSRIIDESIQ